MKRAVYWILTYLCFLGGVMALALLPPLADALMSLPGLRMSFAANFFIALFLLLPLAVVFFFLALFFHRRFRRKL